MHFQVFTMIPDETDNGSRGQNFHFKAYSMLANRQDHTETIAQKRLAFVKNPEKVVAKQSKRPFFIIFSNFYILLKKYQKRTFLMFVYVCLSNFYLCRRKCFSFFHLSFLVIFLTTSRTLHINKKLLIHLLIFYSLF